MRKRKLPSLRAGQRAPGKSHAELAAAIEALRRERNFINAVVNTAGALVVVLNPAGEVVRFNKACERTSGYRFKEVEGLRFWDLVIPSEQRRAVEAAFAELCAGEFPSQFENYWVTRDGSKRFISWSNTVLVGDDGKVEFVIGTGVDITERRHAEEALRRSEERNRTILRTAQDGFWVLDSRGFLLDVNDAYCELVGYRRDELIGQHVSLVEVNEDETEVQHHVARVIREGFDRFETRHRRKDGEIIHVEVSVNFLPFEGGQLVTFLRDVTERKRDAEELERRRGELAAIIDSTGDAIVFTDPQRRIAMTNPAFTKMFGYRNEEVLGRDTHFLDVDGRDAMNRLDPRAGVRESGERRHFEIQCRRKDGSTLWVETHAVEVTGHHGNLLGYVAFHRDVSERKSAESQMRASLAEKEVLLKEIHHRVKNNLQVIASMLNLQADRLEDETALAPLRESRNRIRSLALIHEKLYRSEHLEKIDFRDYLTDLAQSIVLSFNQSSTAIEVETHIDDVGFCIDTAIPVALIVNELVSNSVKHAFKGRAQGHIVLSLKCHDDRRCELSVADDGLGLPKGLDPAASPTLGLQLVDVLATQLDGSFQMRNNGGACFTIVFSDPTTRGETA